MKQKQIIAFPIDETNSIFVEVEIDDDEGEIEVSRDGIAKKALKTFQDSLSAIKPIAETYNIKCIET